MTLFQRITRGHNLWLYARLVTNLKASHGKLTWIEPPSEAELRQELKERGDFGGNGPFGRLSM